MLPASCSAARIFSSIEVSSLSVFSDRSGSENSIRVQPEISRPASDESSNRFSSIFDPIIKQSRTTY